MNIKVAIIHPLDPFGFGIGGINTFIKGFIKYSPEYFDISFIGISSDCKARPSRKWAKLNFGDRKFDFYPLFYEKDENKKRIIPLTLRFTFYLKILKIKIHRGILLFDRIEPAIVFRKKYLPKIVIIHNDVNKRLKNESEVTWSKFPWLYSLYENFIMNFFNIVYTVNKNNLIYYKSKYYRQKEKFYFLPTWADTEIFYPINKKKEEIRKEILIKNKDLTITGKWILFVGRLQLQKAPLRLIETFHEYHKKNKNNYLLIIGEGNLEQKIKNYVRKLELEKSVFFIKSINQNELVKYYCASDVLLLTSNFEGMPRCVLEALSCGLPVVSTNVGEVNMVVKNDFSGEIVQSFNPFNISQAIKKVLDNPDDYSKFNCLNSISEYTPNKVLKPLYKMIEILSKCYM